MHSKWHASNWLLNPIAEDSDMTPLRFASIVTLCILAAPEVLADDWPQWRGPNKDNHAPDEATPPIEWSEGKNVKWRTPIPGRGHSTPIFVEGKIYLTTAEKEKSTQSL